MAGGEASPGIVAAGAASPAAGAASPAAGDSGPAARPRLLDRYAAHLPLTVATPHLSLGEGATPLVHAERLGAAWGIPNLYLKFEGSNPTGSFKDRGMVLAVAKAVEEGATAIVCASTGNTSASAAAYGAAAGLEVVVVLPAGKIAAGKLLQAQAAGARVLAVRGNFDAALAAVRELASQDEHPVTLVNSLNPYRLLGQQTAAFEVCDDLGGPPDILAIPVGNAGNISAYWMGFRAYLEAGRIDLLPRMWGFQAAGAAPIVLGRPVEHPETFATAIRIGNPASWEKAVAARDESGGLIEAVTDDEIFGAYREVVALAGIFCEPASAASLAGVRRLRAEGRLDPEARVVCVLTGHGLKDPDSGARLAAGHGVLEAEASLRSIVEALGWG
jgi:threonine synthase